VIINEVRYDDMEDDGEEIFVELFGPPGTSLEGFNLLGWNGGNNAEYLRFPLSGQIPEDSLFVIAHPRAAPALMARANLLHAGVDFQNGADAIQLRWGEEIVDALAYGDDPLCCETTPGGEGRPAPDANYQHSLSRDEEHSDTDDNARDFQLAEPSPGIGGGVEPLPSCEGDDCRLIRIMAANLSCERGQSYTHQGMRLFQGLHPDIVLIQEFSYDSTDFNSIADFIAQSFGPEFQWVRGDDSLPNGVISRFPILESGIWRDPHINNRDFPWARIDLPGPIDLWAVSLHLKASSGDRDIRLDEVNVLVPLIQGRIPAGDYLVIGGDLNTSSRNEECLLLLDQVISRAHQPVDQRGDPDTNMSQRKTYDWVLPNLNLEAFHTDLIIGDHRYPHGLVFDSRDYNPLADVAPIQRLDSSDCGMQHLAVIKDFRLPE